MVQVAAVLEKQEQVEKEEIDAEKEEATAVDAATDGAASENPEVTCGVNRATSITFILHVSVGVVLRCLAATLSGYTSYNCIVGTPNHIFGLTLSPSCLECRWSPFRRESLPREGAVGLDAFLPPRTKKQNSRV